MDARAASSVLSGHMVPCICAQWLAVHFITSFVFVAEGQPLGVKIPGAFGSGDIELIRKAQQEAQNEVQNEFRRSFGLGEVVGHTVTFIHEVLDGVAPHVRRKLSDLAFEADKTAGWNVTRGLEYYDSMNDTMWEESALTARCIEFISYSAGEGEDHSDSDSLGWHQDGGTLMTTAVLLSSPSSFAGGWIELANDDGEASLYENITLQAGDFISWRGWTSHRVSPLIVGERDILVVEWWNGEDVTASQLPRGSDTVEGLKHAITLDPTSSYLHRTLGRKLCQRLPCNSDGEAQEAEVALRQALRLAPKKARMHIVLANFLGGIGAFRHFYNACSLEPASLPCFCVAFFKTIDRMFKPASVDEIGEEALWDDMMRNLARLLVGGVAATLLFLFIWRLEGKRWP